MSIIFQINPSPDGNPNGSLDGPSGSLFYKEDTDYKINYSGFKGNNWETVYFQPTTLPHYFRTQEDLDLLVYNTGSYLYTKTTPEGILTGWKLLSRDKYIYQKQ